MSGWTKLPAASRDLVRYELAAEIVAAIEERALHVDPLSEGWFTWTPAPRDILTGFYASEENSLEHILAQCGALMDCAKWYNRQGDVVMRLVKGGAGDDDLLIWELAFGGGATGWLAEPRWPFSAEMFNQCRLFLNELHTDRFEGSFASIQGGDYDDDLNAEFAVARANAFGALAYAPDGQYHNYFGRTGHVLYAEIEEEFRVDAYYGDKVELAVNTSRIAAGTVDAAYLMVVNDAEWPDLYPDRFHKEDFSYKFSVDGASCGTRSTASWLSLPSGLEYHLFEVPTPDSNLNRTGVTSFLMEYASGVSDDPAAWQPSKEFFSQAWAGLPTVYLFVKMLYDHRS